MPDSTRKRTPCMDSLAGRCHSSRAQTIAAATSKTTMVRKNVARSELISDTATLPKIAVSAAKKADPTAYVRQSGLMSDHRQRPRFAARKCCIEARDFRGAQPQCAGAGILLHVRDGGGLRDHEGVRMPQQKRQRDLACGGVMRR